MLKKIEFYSYFSFLFWVIPGMSKIKEINIDNVQSEHFSFSTSVAQGQASIINKNFALCLRYIPILIILTIFDSFNIIFKIEFLFTLILACFLTFIVKNINQYKKHLLYYVSFFFLVIIPFSTYLVFEFDLKYLFYLFLNVFKMFITTYTLYTIYEDFKNRKKYNFFLFKEGKLVFKVEK